MARSSVEHALFLLNLCKDHGDLDRQIDLREGLRALPALEATGPVEQKMDFAFIKLYQSLTA